MKLLNVVPITVQELANKWNSPHVTWSPSFTKEPIFIRSNSKGEINWDKAPVYTRSELKNRNVQVLF